MPVALNFTNLIISTCVFKFCHFSRPRDGLAIKGIFESFFLSLFYFNQIDKTGTVCVRPLMANVAAWKRSVASITKIYLV